MTNNEIRLLATNASILINSKQLKFGAIRRLNDVVKLSQSLQVKANEIIQLGKDNQKENEVQDELVKFGEENFTGELPTIDISLFDDFDREEFTYFEGEDKKEKKIDLVNILLFLKDKGILV